MALLHFDVVGTRMLNCDSLTPTPAFHLQAKLFKSWLKRLKKSYVIIDMDLKQANDPTPRLVMKGRVSVMPTKESINNLATEVTEVVSYKCTTHIYMVPLNRTITNVFDKAGHPLDALC